MKYMIAVIAILLFLVLASEAFAQEPGVVAPEADPFPLDQTIIWVIGLFVGLAAFSMAVPAVLQVAKEQFLDKLLVVLWVLVRAILRFFMKENTPEFTNAFKAIRKWTVVLIVAGAAYYASLTQYDAMITGAPQNIAMMDEWAVRLGFTVLLAGGAFLFHKKAISDAIPVDEPTFTVIREAA